VSENPFRTLSAAQLQAIIGVAVSAALGKSVTCTITKVEYGFQTMSDTVELELSLSTEMDFGESPTPAL
jgi:hypothetical protein